MKSKNELTFEQGILRLEEIVKMLEKGTASLDESLKLYEEGITLVRFCNAELDNAEKKIKMLMMSSDGSIAEQDFSDNTDNA